MVLPVDEYETNARDEQGEFVVAVERSDEGQCLEFNRIKRLKGIAIAHRPKYYRRDEAGLISIMLPASGAETDDSKYRFYRFSNCRLSVWLLSLSSLQRHYCSPFSAGVTKFQYCTLPCNCEFPYYFSL
jgi:hypothetical protein